MAITDTGIDRVAQLFDKIKSSYGRELINMPIEAACDLIAFSFLGEFGIELDSESAASLMYDYFVNNTKRRDIRDIRNAIFFAGDNIDDEFLLKYKLKNENKFFAVYYSFKAISEKDAFNKEVKEYISHLLDKNSVYKIFKKDISTKMLNVMMASNYLLQTDNYLIPTLRMLNLLSTIKKNIFIVYPPHFYELL